MIVSPKVRRSSSNTSNGNNGLRFSNNKWVSVRPNINQKRSCNIIINPSSSDCMADNDDDDDSAIVGCSPTYGFECGSFVDLSGFTPNSFEFKYPKIGNSPSTLVPNLKSSSENIQSAVSPSTSLGSSFKNRYSIDTWKLANPDSTITIKKVKTSPRDRKLNSSSEEQDENNNNHNSNINNNNKPILSTSHSQSQSNIISLSSSSSSINNNNNNNNNSNGNNTVSRARSKQLTKTPSSSNIHLISSTPHSQSLSSASSLISHTQRRLSRAKQNQVDPNLLNSVNGAVEKPNQYALVLYDFEADLEEEMPLTKDTTIIVLEQCADGWWVGKDSKRVGKFPQNYVKLLPSMLPNQVSSKSQQSQEKVNNSTINNNNNNNINNSINNNNNNNNNNSINNNSNNSNNNQNEIIELNNDPNLFFPTYLSSNLNSNGSVSSSLSFSFRQRSIRKNSLSSIVHHIKVYVPPFHEHTIVSIQSNENLKDLIEKVGRKKKILINDYKCKIRYINSDSDLNLEMSIALLRDIPLRLQMAGIDYINQTQLSTTTRNIQLSNYFNISYNNIKNNNQPQQQQQQQQNKTEKQWVIFDNQSIQIFKNHTDQQPTRVIGLKYSTIKLLHSSSSSSSSLSNAQPPSFVIKTPFSTFRFSHDYFNIISQWVEVIELSPEYFENNQNFKKKQKKFMIKSSDSFSSSLSLSGHFPPPVDRKQQILEIRNKGCNRVCVDCCSTDPEWASISLGCFLCDICCDIHQQNLASNMSEVLSVILDDSWEEYHIDIFSKIGNSVSNQYWEYNLNHKKVRPSSTKKEKCDFIISKYKNKEFIPQNAPSPISLFK